MQYGATSSGQSDDQVQSLLEGAGRASLPLIRRRYLGTAARHARHASAPSRRERRDRPAAEHQSAQINGRLQHSPDSPRDAVPRMPVHRRRLVEERPRRQVPAPTACSSIIACAPAAPSAPRRPAAEPQLITGWLMPAFQMRRAEHRLRVSGSVLRVFSSEHGDGLVTRARPDDASRRPRATV